MILGRAGPLTVKLSKKSRRNIQKAVDIHKYMVYYMGVRSVGSGARRSGVRLPFKGPWA